MRRQRLLWGCLTGGVAAFCTACSGHPSGVDRNDNTADHVKVTVANKGSETLYEVRVRIGDEEFKLGSFAPGIVASRKFIPTANQLGKTVIVAVEYEHEDEEVVHL